MKLRLFSIFLTVALIFGLVPVAMATETETTAATEQTKPVRGEFECGEDMVWAYEDGVLTITGTGEMDDYEQDAPWAEYKDGIESVILAGGVTYIGAEAFRDYDNLTEVDFGKSLKEIGARAFMSCDGLAAIELPTTFKIFGESSFQSCKNLTEIHCSGGFPSFRLNCLWDTYSKIYFPVERPWAVSLIEELENAFHGRIEFLASDGSDPFVPTEATTQPQETEAPTTEATTQPTTEETTEATEPVTEATVQETTAAPETTGTPTEETVAPTVPGEPDEGDNGILVLLAGLGVAVVLTLIVAVVMVLRQLRKKGKYSI